jgi:diguanylate cyclase (GGDEF)-like protein/PAS domain S-box-containing protein
MKERDKTKSQLTHEVAELRRRIAELEELEIQHNQAEETLLQREEKYRTILESIEEGYYEVDLAGNFTFLNDSMSRIWGYPKEELIGMNNRQFTDRENAKRLFQDFNRSYKTGEAGKIVDYEIIRKDGGKRNIETSFSIIRDASGKATGFRGIIRDITERKKAEKTLRRSEETAKRLAQENATIAEIGRIVSSTLNIEEIYGHFAEEVKKLIPFDRIAINTINYEDETVTVAYVTGVDVTDRLKGTAIPLAGTLAGEVVRTRKSMVIQTEDPKKVADRFPGLLVSFQAGIRSLMAIPLISKDEVVGALHFHSAKSNAYREKDLRLAEEVGNQIAGAISNAQLFIERKKAEDSLRQSEERYRTILENIEDGYYEVDLAGKFTFFNDSMCRIYGYSREEFMSISYRQYTDQETAKKVYQAYNRVYRTGEPGRGFDHELIRKDGTKRYIEASISLLKDSSGKPTGFRGIVRDITERKKAEEALRQSEEKYRTILESMEEGYYEVDLAGNFTFFNDSMCRALGYSKEELMGMNNRQYTDQENAKRLFQAFNKVYRTGEPGSVCDHEIIRKDGTKRYIETSVSLRKDALGNPVGFRGIIRDITEHKKAEESLRQSEEKYRTILESIEEGYCEVDLTGNFTFFNDSMCRIFGYPKEELMGMNNRQYTDQENAKKLYQAFNQVYRTGKSHRGYDYEIIRKNGTKRYIETSVSLRKDALGNPVGFRGIVRDITEHRKFERVLQQERETFFSILQKEPYGALLIDADDTFLYVNPEFTAITGYTIKDVPNGKEWLRKAFPDLEYRHKIIATWKEDATRRKGVDRVWSVVCKEGEVKEIEFKLTFLDDGRIIVMLSDVTERKRTEEELAYKATHDLLTGLPNRMLFKDRFSVAMAQAQRFHKKLAVIFLDLDRFKEVNDTLGHNAGDKLLYAVGNRLTELLRKTDTVARMGGDEFLLLLPNVDAMEDVVTISQTVLDVLRRPFIVGGREVSISASIGVSIYPDDGTDVDTLVSRADKAMYEVKQRGNDTCQHDPQSITGQTSE